MLVEAFIDIMEMDSSSTVLLPTAYLGNISYYAKIKNTATHHIERHENYIKQTIRNRCTILGANGSLSLTIPIHRPSGIKVKIDEVEISNIDQWQRIHWQAIVSAYNSSPFFEYYEDYFRPLFEKRFEYLFDFNCELHLIVLKLLKIKSELQFTQEYSQQSINDFRDTKKLIGQTDLQEYYQVFSYKIGFQENLSILDLLCNEGPRALEYL